MDFGPRTIGRALGVGILVMSTSAVAVASQPHDPGAKSAVAPSPDEPRDTKHYNLGKKALAIQGYDPVAYFPEGGGKPTKGKESFTYQYRGVTYRFASPENLDRFKASPERYEPAHGGWCSSAIADSSEKVEINPQAFRVQDGRLFLFYKTVFQDARNYWDKDTSKNLVTADEHWKKISGESPPRIENQPPAPGQ